MARHVLGRAWASLEASRAGMAQHGEVVMPSRHSPTWLEAYRAHVVLAQHGLAPSSTHRVPV